ncbi:30S ribosomal protein S11 [Kiritimatiella glycovorans]|uniref:Small ribosomal subunit protein uS11 n=1 Tax=Kiritimatiella glycovorans TaxID=1307763 RepID=A0A0G3EHN0_9BACT|nr:30S ribosomal protein S11 [Kiritimatiella glycovorans]
MADEEKKQSAEAEEPQAESTDTKPTEAQPQASEQEASGGSATAADLLGEEEPAPAKPKGRGKGGRHIPSGVAFVKATFNNTIVSITDKRGNVVAWSAAGRCGFKGSRKSTAFAATTVAREAARDAISKGMNEVEIRVQGPGAGRESAIRALQAAGLNISAIKDTTGVPHNGCRPPKRRRV